MLSILSCLSLRLLVCAPTNTAVGEIAKRFIEFASTDASDKNEHRSQQFGHFCEELSVEGNKKKAAPIQLGDIVLAGNEDRCALEDSLFRIFLPMRVTRLARALHPRSGLVSTANAVVQMLTPGCARANYTEGECARHADYACYVKHQLEARCKTMTHHVLTLLNDLPSQLLVVSGIAKLRRLVEAVKEFLLILDTLTVSEAECWFDKLETEEEPSISGPSQKNGVAAHDDAEQILKPGLHANLSSAQASAVQQQATPYTNEKAEVLPVKLEMDNSLLESGDLRSPNPSVDLGAAVSAQSDKTQKIVIDLIDSPQDSVTERYEAYSKLKQEICQFIDEFPDLFLSFPKDDSPESSIRAFFETECIKFAQIVFSTVSAAGRVSIRNTGHYSCVIIDEAAQLIEAETTVVAQIDGTRGLILVGDHKQLPATVLSQVGHMPYL